MGDDDLFHEIRRRIDEQIPYDPGEHHIDNAARAVLPLIEEERRRAVREALDGVEKDVDTIGPSPAVYEIIAAHRERAT